jgi:excisionase family DNA binding protein
MTAQALTPRDVAAVLQCHVATVYRMMEAGTLPYWSPTPRKRFVSSAVLERLMAQGLDAEAAA